MIEQGALSEGHGRALLALQDHELRRMKARLERVLDQAEPYRQRFELAQHPGHPGPALQLVAQRLLQRIQHQLGRLIAVGMTMHPHAGGERLADQEKAGCRRGGGHEAA